MLIRRSGATAALALATVLAAGCSSSEPSGKADPAAARRAQTALNEVQAVKEQVGLLEAQLIKKCMIDKGFKVFPPLPEAMPDGNAKKSTGVTPEIADAERSGYDISTLLKARSVDSSEQGDGGWKDLPSSEKQKFTLAQMGPADERVKYDFGDGQVSAPTGGCYGSVRSAMYGDQKTYLRLDWIATNQSGADGSQATEADAEVLKAKTAWSACMGKAGYPSLAAPVDARKLAETYYAGRTADSPADELRSALEQEIKVATADARCGTESGLNKAVATAQAAANGVFLTEHEADLVQYRTIMVGAVKQGQKMLGS